MALLPAYLCESVVAAFQAHGCLVEFFAVGIDLAADLDQIAHLLRAQRVRVVLVIHYFGFRLAATDELADLCAEHGVALIEDCAHALFSRTGTNCVGGKGAASIFSLRKSLAIPEGGVLILPTQDPGFFPERLTPKPREIRGLARELVYWLEFKIGLSPRTVALSRDTFRKKVYDRAGRESIDAAEAIGGISAFVLEHVDPAAMVSARRANFAYYMENLSNVRRPVSPLFRELPEGTCPLGLPLLASDRDDLRRRLLRHGVAVRTYWDVLPKSIDPSRFPESAKLRDRILVLPSHQSLRKTHLDTVLEILDKA